MTRKDRSRLFSTTRAALISWLAIGALLVLSIYRFIEVASADPGGSILPILFGVLALAALILLVLSIRSESRLRHFHRVAPDAYVIAVEIYTDSISQIRRMPASLVGQSGRLHSPMFALLAVQQSRLEIMGGMMFGFGGRAKVLVSLELPNKTSAAVVRAPQGLYRLKTLEISFNHDGQVYALNLMPMRTLGGIIQWQMSQDQITGECERLRSVLDTSGMSLA